MLTTHILEEVFSYLHNLTWLSRYLSRYIDEDGVGINCELVTFYICPLFSSRAREQAGSTWTILLASRLQPSPLSGRIDLSPNFDLR